MNTQTISQQESVSRFPVEKTNFFNVWISSWIENRKKILVLCIINTFITLLSEIGVRTFLSSVLTDGFTMGFVSKSALNKQSLLNIFSTLSLTFLGVPIFYIKQLKIRFVVFIIFGLASTIFAQFILIILRSDYSFSQTRLMFDITYLTTIKFIFFELFRIPIVTSHYWEALLKFRLTQDTLQTTIKTIILSMIGLKE